MDRMISTQILPEDVKIENRLRPVMLEDYIGQEKAKNNLKVFIEAAKKRNEALDHVLLYGPPGLGKTTMASIIANEMGSTMKITSGPAIEKPGELAAILNNLNEHDVLFIDEIHRLNRQVEEVLYPAMEDFAIDIMIGKGQAARSIRLDLPKFTLVGATTRAGMLTQRFGYLDFGNQCAASILGCQRWCKSAELHGETEPSVSSSMLYGNRSFCGFACFSSYAEDSNRKES